MQAHVWTVGATNMGTVEQDWTCIFPRLYGRWKASGANFVAAARG